MEGLPEGIKASDLLRSAPHDYHNPNQNQVNLHHLHPVLYTLNPKPALDNHSPNQNQVNTALYHLHPVLYALNPKPALE